MSSGARVCILDPLASYLGADVSMNLANEVRPRFEALIEVAKETGCAIIVIAHMNKMEGLNAKYRNSGSIDIVASVRSALVIGQSGDEPSHRVLAHSKSNLAPTGDSILFSVSDGVVEFIDTIDITADQLVGAYGANKAKETKQAVARRELQDMLSEGQLPQKEIMARMSELGISQRTCEMAKATLPIESVRVGDHFEWVLGGRPDGNYATMYCDIPF